MIIVKKKDLNSIDQAKIPEILDAEILDELQADSDYDIPSDNDIIDLDAIAHSNKSELDIIAELLPVVSKGTSLVPTVAPGTDSLKQYLKEINRYKLLSREEEAELTKKLHETGDIDVAKKLVMANLRLVVKIAMEYRSAYKNVMDLIQEGNIGLMKAVSKYNPDKGAKLSYYASWWIKSYILKFILDNFKLIKIGTTAEQKKLFYNLMKEKDRLKSQGIEPDVKLISENLGVSQKSVKEMDLRLGTHGAEVSLDTPIGSEGSESTLNDFIEGQDDDIDDTLANKQGLKILEDNLDSFISELKPRDKDVFRKRLLSEVPPSLQSIADEYGVSRERIRQIEARLLEKLKVYMSDFIR